MRAVIPKTCVAKTQVMVKDGENTGRVPAIQLNPRPVPKKQQVVLPTVSTPPKFSSQQVPEPPKKCHDSIAEALINVQNIFQTVWETIDHWCTAIQSAIKEPTSEITRNSEMVLEKLVPLVTDLRHKYHLCLSFPPLDIRNRRAEFDDLCNHLRLFFTTLNMDSTHSTAVMTDDLLVFFGTLDKRPTLQAGLSQLDVMIQALYECVKRMPD
ncbi:uncharacterized protein LOC121383348 [Gigantopelta aegis]|uniref:uncharacterized protein LOC121383348 n=1 Tax=Gigantopelta aegis TaxID=1735272 RepID=UPI001B88E4AB|nr:uncharacterized protein LOC121383348 [Gigantopelta aegis]